MDQRGFLGSHKSHQCYCYSRDGIDPSIQGQGCAPQGTDGMALLGLCVQAGMGFPGGSEGKDPTYNVGYLGFSPGSGRSPGEGNGNPLQYFCLENPMDGGAWRAISHGVAKSQTQLSTHSSVGTVVKLSGEQEGLRGSVVVSLPAASSFLWVLRAPLGKLGATSCLSIQGSCNG